MDNRAREYIKQIVTASEYIRRHIDEVPKICIVLGSGLGPLADKVTKITEMPYSDIPYFPVSTAPGHPGTLLYGEIDGKEICAFSGKNG